MVAKKLRYRSSSGQTNSLEDIEGLAKNHEAVEGRALSIGMRHIKDNGVEGLEEIFNTFAWC